MICLSYDLHTFILLCVAFKLLKSLFYINFQFNLYSRTLKLTISLQFEVMNNITFDIFLEVEIDLLNKFWLSGSKSQLNCIFQTNYTTSGSKSLAGSKKCTSTHKELYLNFYICMLHMCEREVAYASRRNSFFYEGEGCEPKDGFLRVTY